MPTIEVRTQAELDAACGRQRADYTIFHLEANGSVTRTLYVVELA